MSDNKNKDQDGVEILPHNYDGIQELDNPLPGWWLATFYITIVFAIGYYGYYEVFDGPTSDQYLETSLQELDAKKKVVAANETVKPMLPYEELIKNKKMMAAGEAQYVGKCAPCHGQKGEGVIGPNLTDKYWIYSKGKIAGILVSIKKGYLDKGMPPWDELIPKDEQPYLAAYVMGLQGTNPPNPKAPQGEEVKE